VSPVEAPPQLYPPDLEEVAELVAEADEFAFDIECFAPGFGGGRVEHFDPFKTQLVGISIAIPWGDDYRAWYIPFGVDPKTGAEYAAISRFREVFAPIFEDKKKRAVAWNAKFDYKILTFNGFVIENILVDGMIASFLCDENFPHNLKDTAARELGVLMKRIKEVWDDPYSLEFFQYGWDDAYYTLKLWKEVFEPRLAEEKMEKPFWAFEMPSAKIAAEMELNGILMDVEYIAEYTKKAQQQMEDIQAHLVSMAGHDFNLNSQKQIAGIMFGPDGLGLPTKYSSLSKPIGKEGKQYWKTNEEVMSRLALLTTKAAEFPRKILEFRKIHKRIRTYCTPYLETHTQTGDGRVHCVFNTIGAETGRWTSRRPNMQNLPRAAKDFSLRKAVIAPEGYVILSADYGQLEMRLMAEMSKDPVLIEIYNRGGVCDCDTYKKSKKKKPDEPRCRHIDVHTRTSEDAGISRQDAKPVNFGAIYGMGWYTLMRQIFKFSGGVITEKEARHMLTSFFKTYGGVKQYHNWVNDICVHRGWIRTILGRKRRLFYVNTSDWRSRGEAFRELCNSSIQGSGADLIMLALRDIDRERWLRAQDDPTWGKIRFISMVHDEMILEVPIEIAAECRLMVIDKMETCVQLKRVPLQASCAYGPTWEDAH
jgi:DNA polymerase-1